MQDSLDVSPVQSPWASHLVECSVVTVLKLLIILRLNLCLVSEVWLDNGTRAWAEEICDVHVCGSLPDFKKY